LKIIDKSRTNTTLYQLLHRKTILLIIDSLVRGGAETILIGTLKDLNARYNVILVTLSNKCQFTEAEILCENYYTLNARTKIGYFKKIWLLKNIIKKHKPDLIHTHLYYSTIIGRLAKPLKIPLLFSVHNQFSKNTGRVEQFIEKITLRKNHVLLAVSQATEDDYNSLIAKTIKSFVLHNYISDSFFSVKRENKLPSEKLKLVAIGNIKKAKNYPYVVSAFQKMKGLPVSLDIFGAYLDHALFRKLDDIVQSEDLPIRFMGPTRKNDNPLSNYDAYVSCSSNEGFGLTVIEAMASGLPALISDINVYREITDNQALFFNLNEEETFIKMIEQILKGHYNLLELSVKGKLIAEKYRLKNYIPQLFNIYDQMMIPSAD